MYNNRTTSPLENCREICWTQLEEALFVFILVDMFISKGTLFERRDPKLPLETNDCGLLWNRVKKKNDHIWANLSQTKMTRPAIRQQVSLNKRFLQIKRESKYRGIKKGTMGRAFNELYTEFKALNKDNPLTSKNPTILREKCERIRSEVKRAER